MSSSPFASCPTEGKDNSALQSAGYIDSTGNLTAAHDAATAAEKAAMRFFKGGKMSIRGLVELDQSNYKGTNIRKANLADAKSVFDVFDVFTTETTEKCRRPIIDAEHNGLAASDGWKMLVCRIPQQFPITDAVPSGFSSVA